MKRVLIVAGPTNHPPGTHEIAASARLLRHCLERLENLPGVRAEVAVGWPNQAQRDAADAVVFVGDTFPANRLPSPQRNLDELGAMMQRGGGLVCIHYAVGLLGADVQPDGDHPLLRWLGGYFANRSCKHHESFARVFQAATIVPAAPQHPAMRGVREYTVHDEPYFNNYFGKDGNRPAANVTTLATALLPPETPVRHAVSWCVERPDGGRGFALVMPHFYRNWRQEDLRRSVLNGIVWAAKLEVPDGGVRSAVPDLAAFQPASVEPLPRPAKTAGKK